MIKDYFILAAAIVMTGFLIYLQMFFIGNINANFTEVFSTWISGIATGILIAIIFAIAIAFVQNKKIYVRTSRQFIVKPMKNKRQIDEVRTLVDNKFKGV